MTVTFYSNHSSSVTKIKPYKYKNYNTNAMKIEVKVTEITHEDLVNLLSTASCGSMYIGFSIPKGNYKGTELEDENDCAEDRWAKVLLAGKKIFFCDHYAEDENDYYGNLPHKWAYYNSPDDGWMRYEISLGDIKDGLARALSSGTYIADYARHLWEEEAINLDLPEAEALMQYIVFGEEIYG